MRSLEGKIIIVGVTGSIAAIETVKLIHELKRKGATIYCVMTDAACKIIHPNALEYATQKPVITQLT
ncbi:MAG: flavoprotein, partial [Halobacteriota archaeon]